MEESPFAGVLALLGRACLAVGMGRIWIETVREARRLIIAVVGFTLVLGGVVMMVTPGPGWLVIFLGLSVLGVEFVWARRLLKRIKEKGAQIGGAMFGRNQKSSSGSDAH
ncbi:MAG: PGPGW domain-containing protein [Candidatus Binataceae bacterium]